LVFFYLPTASAAVAQSFFISQATNTDSAVAAMAPSNGPPGTVPVPLTEEFHIFVQTHPNLATKAIEYDEMAREFLKGKYTAFAQGTQAVIAHRTAQNPAAHHQAGV